MFYCSSLFFPVNVGGSFSVGWFCAFCFLFLLRIYNPFIVSLQSFLIDQYIYINDGSSYSCACIFFLCFVYRGYEDSGRCISAIPLSLHEDQVV